MAEAKLSDDTLMDKPVKVRYRDRIERDGCEIWHAGNVSFSSLRDALQAIETEGANITVEYMILMTLQGELVLGQEDMKRLIAIGKRGGRTLREGHGARSDTAS